MKDSSFECAACGCDGRERIFRQANACQRKYFNMFEKRYGGFSFGSDRFIGRLRSTDKPRSQGGFPCTAGFDVLSEDHAIFVIGLIHTVFASGMTNEQRHEIPNHWAITAIGNSKRHDQITIPVEPQAIMDVLRGLCEIRFSFSGPLEDAATAMGAVATDKDDFLRSLRFGLGSLPKCWIERIWVLTRQWICCVIGSRTSDQTLSVWHSRTGFAIRITNPQSTNSN